MSKKKRLLFLVVSLSIPTPLFADILDFECHSRTSNVYYPASIRMSEKKAQPNATSFQMLTFSLKGSGFPSNENFPLNSFAQLSRRDPSESHWLFEISKINLGGCVSGGPAYGYWVHRHDIKMRFKNDTIESLDTLVSFEFSDASWETGCGSYRPKWDYWMSCRVINRYLESRE